MVPEIAKLYKNHYKLHIKNANHHVVKFAYTEKQKIIIDKDRYTMIHKCLEKILSAIIYQIGEPIIINMDREHGIYFTWNERKIVTSICCIITVLNETLSKKKR